MLCTVMDVHNLSNLFADISTVHLACSGDLCKKDKLLPLLMPMSIKMQVELF